MIGTQLGSYRVDSELGSGGMGTVYLATVVDDAPGLKRGARVAVKVVHPNLLGTPGAFKRFLREAQLGKDVRHPNVVRTLDVDAVELSPGKATHFLVMEYVEGQTLRGLLQELGRVPEELCRHIATEVAKALKGIHEASIVHRDLKPENVLITKDHQVKVMDLGVAQLAGEAMRLTQTGHFVGSLYYAAPEQFSSERDLDGRADLYSLGVLLYELATGKHPFKNGMSGRVLPGPAQGLPRSAAELNPQLSPFMEELIATLVQPERDARFRSAAKLLEALQGGERSDWWQARAREIRVETRRPLRRIRIPRETALYGRDSELRLMRGLYDKALAGDGQVLLIEGEAGIGKTRLVDEFVGKLREEGEDIGFLFGNNPPGGAATAAGA
ncbi:MAG: serine/threonine-protein kinase, partial [Planctomycetota bacterium]